MNLSSLFRHPGFPPFTLGLGIALILVRVMILVRRDAPQPLTPTVMRPTTATACFGDHRMENAQHNAELWVRGGLAGSIQAPSVPRSARVRCLPIAPNDRWAQCSIGPVDDSGPSYVVSCDTSQFNNIGCVSGR
jgi:hypothetical protein